MLTESNMTEMKLPPKPTTDDIPTENLMGHEEGKYGSWTVVAYLGKSRSLHGHSTSVIDMWQCVCKCGNEKPVTKYNLKRGGSIQCMDCDRKARRVSVEHRKFVQKMASERQSWQRIVVLDCVEEWLSFENFYAWKKATRNGLLHLRKRDESKPHGPQNSYWSDVLLLVEIKKKRLIEIFVSEGMTESEAAARFNSISKQRRNQLLNVAAGLCSRCGDALGQYASLCDQCERKKVIGNRIKKGMPIEAAVSKPTRQRSNKPSWQCRKCDKIAGNYRLCAEHQVEHKFESRISQRMKKWGLTREEAINLPKGMHLAKRIDKQLQYLP